MRILSSNEIRNISGGDGIATYSGGSWQYGNACYVSAQAAANAGATGFYVNGQHYGSAGNPFKDPNLKNYEM